jgi:hypothetical protein
LVALTALAVAVVAWVLFATVGELAVKSVFVAPVPTTNSAELAAGAATTDRTPAVSADTATSAMRCLIVFVDIYFLP